MLSQINLLGRLPYRLEYSQGLNKSNGHRYRNPYGVIYSSPFEETFSDYKSDYIDRPYKVSRLLSEYSFYTSFKRVPSSASQLKLNMNF